MSKAFCATIRDQIVQAVATGKRHFVYWGFNENCIHILAEIKELGLLESCTSGIIDSAPQRQGSQVFGFQVLPPEGIRDLNLEVLVITSDEDKEAYLQEFATYDDRLPEVILSGTAHFAFRDPVFEEIMSSCLVKSYANGYENSLIHIYQSIKYLAANGIQGNVAEFGIFKGGTIVFIAKTLNHFGLSRARIFGFDIFDGFPSRKTVFDLYSNPKCEFSDFAAVEDYCRRYSIEVIKGDICETHTTLRDQPLMLSFFDTDNYSPSRAALKTCYEQTVTGGILAFDHYISEDRFLYTIGERMAAADFLRDKNIFHLHGTGIFMKCS